MNEYAWWSLGWAVLLMVAAWVPLLLEWYSNNRGKKRASKPAPATSRERADESGGGE